MNNRILTLLTSMVIALSLSAQEVDSESLLLYDLERDMDMVDEGFSADEANKVKLLQLGHNNSAVTDQNNSSHSLPNVVTAFQHGINNEVFILQAGSGNTSRVLQQGISNDYELELEGDDNTTNLLQQGAGNTVEQYINADGVDYTVVQQGLNNELIQIENNPEMPDYTIWQRGTGISVRIENVSIY